jgi:hypothetical protein
MPARKRKPIRKSATRKSATRRAPKRKFQPGGEMAQTGLSKNGGTAYVPDPNAMVNDRTWGAFAGGGVMGSMVSLNATEGEDLLTDTVKITAGYFTNGSGQLNAANIYTGSLANSNEAYYFNITQAHPLTASAATQFAVAYGHAGGSGSDTDAGAVPGPTQAIYGQWATTLLDESEISGGFRISTNEGNNPTNKVLSARDEDIYVLVGKRERFKDRINKKNWTIALSGSTSADSASVRTGAGLLKLTDDSNTTAGTGTVAGTRYNIVSGTNGALSGSGASDKVYGWIYPEMGVMVFSAAELSSSIPGKLKGTNMTASFGKVPSIEPSFASCSGFAPNLNANGNAANAMRFVNCLQPAGSYLKFRSEEDQVSTSYFCRVRAKDLNFSNNPTFVSGSSNEISNTDMWGNPNVYISGIGLYGSSGTLVALGKLSTSLKKNFSTEATIKVKLTY